MKKIVFVTLMMADDMHKRHYPVDGNSFIEYSGEVYYAINASLEATIDNHRRSQTNWQVLYKEHGKISQQQ